MNQEKKEFAFKKVMVIDDSEIDRYVASYNIKRHCFAEEVILKESAKGALEYLLASAGKPDNLPHFIFLDIRMREMDGFAFLEEYGKLPETVRQNCIMLMVSSSLDTEDHQKAEQNKFVNSFLEKPLDKNKLEALTHLTINEQQTRPG
jgi:CheY-like chemotaxis protein